MAPGKAYTTSCTLDRGKRTFTAHFGTPEGTAPIWLNFAAKRIKGKELLIVASNRPAHHALTTYRTRWAIECMFAEAKTKGFNPEDTRLSIAKKLSLLMGLIALAMAWAAKTASAKLGNRKRPRKSHGRYAISIFRTGLDEIRRLLRTNPKNAFKHEHKIRQKIACVVYRGLITSASPNKDFARNPCERTNARDSALLWGKNSSSLCISCSALCFILNNNQTI